MDVLSARGQVALARGNREEAAKLFATVEEFWRGFAPESSYARDAAQWQQRAR